MTIHLYARWESDRHYEFLRIGDCGQPLATIAVYNAGHLRVHLHFLSPGVVLYSRKGKDKTLVMKEVEEKFLRYMQQLTQEEVKCDDIPF